MAFTKITDLPKSDISWITPDTHVAVRESGCDPMVRTTAGEIAEALGKKLSRDYFEKFTPNDRHNLCDIVWYLKGMKAADKSPFSDQIDTLEEVVRCLGDKFRAK